MRCLLLALFFLVSAGESAQSTPSHEAARYDAGEEKPGGATTHRKKSGRTAFLHPAANLPADKGLDFRVGQGFFKKYGSPHPPQPGPPTVWGRCSMRAPANSVT